MSLFKPTEFFTMRTVGHDMREIALYRPVDKSIDTIEQVVRTIKLAYSS